MNAGILKIGTMPVRHYFIRGGRELSDYQVGDGITYREQGLRQPWEHGIIREIIIDVPRVERM